MRKAVFFLAVSLLIASLSGCGGSKDEGKSSPADNQAAVQTEKAQDASAQALKWPAEFDDWGIPTIDDATVALVEDRSMSGGVMTQGINIVVNLSKLPKADFDAYCAQLEKSGFVKNPDSLADIMLYYDKSIDGGVIELILSYSEDTTTIVANNSAVAAQNAEGAGGKADWPESAKAIPVFTKGTFKETVEMGGGMYAITFTGVTDADLDWYRGELDKAGFESQENEDTEGYAKWDKNMAYSVGFVYENGTLQIIVMSGSY